jgi:cytochrome P450
MGLPLDDGRELYKLTEVIHTAPEAQPENAIPEAIMQMFEYGMSVIKEKRDRPGDDLASKLLAAEVDGRRLTDQEFLLFFMLLIDAGGDTTRNLVGTGLYELMQHPAQLALLQSDVEGYLPTARDELLRWTSPVTYMRRTATRDTNLGDQHISAGDKVVMYYAAANRDPSAFNDPHSLDITRQFARIEIDAILREVLNRMDEFQLLEEVSWMPSNFICGVTRMPLAFSKR